MQDEAGDAVPALLRDFRAMRATLLKGGLFKSNKAYYLWKLVSTFSLLGVAVSMLLLAARESMLALVHPNLHPEIECEHIVGTRGHGEDGFTETVTHR